VNDLIAMRKAGETITELANQFLVSRTMVSRILKENNIEAPWYSKSRPRQIIFAYHTGMKKEKIAELFNVSKNYVYSLTCKAVREGRVSNYKRVHDEVIAELNELRQYNMDK